MKPFKFFHGYIISSPIYNFRPYIPFYEQRPNTYYTSIDPISTEQYNETQTYDFVIGANATPVRLLYNGDMDMDSVRAMTWDLRHRYSSWVSITEQVLGFMGDYLNEHLSGTSIVTLR